MIWSIVYRSWAAGDPARVEDDLAAIEAACRRNNPKNAVTGALIHCQGMYGQVLEGPVDRVTHRFIALARDTRHQRLQLLHAGPLVRRRFDQFSMLILRPGDMDITILSQFRAEAGFQFESLTAPQIEALAQALADAVAARGEAFAEML